MNGVCQRTTLINGARGYFVLTVGRDEELIREYIRHQEEENRRIEQMIHPRREHSATYVSR